MHAFHDQTGRARATTVAKCDDLNDPIMAKGEMGAGFSSGVGVSLNHEQRG